MSLPAVDTVVAAVLCRGAEVLLCNRAPTRAWYPNVWDLPGGHDDRAEPPRAALVRELREELAVEVAEAAVPVRPQWQLLETGLQLSIWRIDARLGGPVNAALDEHDEIGWFGLTGAVALTLAHPAYPALLRELPGLR